MSSNIAEKKSEGEGTSTLNSTRRMKRSVKCAKQFFRKEYWISIYSGAIQIKYKKRLPRLLALQTTVDAIVRFNNVRKDRGMLKIVSQGKLSERGLWIMTNTTGKIRAYQRMKQ